MNMIALLQQQLGPMTYPLLICSFITAAVIVERISVLGFISLRNSVRQSAQRVIQQYQHQNRELREEVLSLWLQNQQKRLSAGIRWLQMIAGLAPLLGLLGTIIGLIQAFEAISLERGPIEPHMLAEGLGVAMKTTAAGLIIAVPAVLGAHGLQWWVEHIIRLTEQAINIKNLQLDSINVEALT